MKARFVVPVIAALALGAGGALAQPAAGMGGSMDMQHMPGMDQMNQRFQRMNAIMAKIKTAHGAQRMALIRDHMKLMQEQMQAMHAMMGDGMMGGQMNGGMMGGKGMGGSMATDHTAMMSAMQTHMDMMQQMMEQMLDQQNVMLQSQDK